MYTYIYVYIYMYIYLNIYVHVYIHVYIYTCMTCCLPQLFIIQKQLLLGSLQKSCCESFGRLKRELPPKKPLYQKIKPNKLILLQVFGDLI